MKERNYGIDLLRIFSMYMIVILHVLGQGGILNQLELLSLKFDFAWLLEIFCYSSVNCYALITGYVMLNSKFNYKKILKLWIDVLFWSLSLTLIMNFIYPEIIGKRDILVSLFPVIFNKYWYFSSYFCLFLFIPFINKLIGSLDRKLFRRLILTIIFLFSIINIFHDPLKISNGYSFLWLGCCYFIGAYLKKYKCFWNIKFRYLLVIMMISLFFTLGFKLFFIKYSNLTYQLFDCNAFIKYNSITILIISVCLLILFSRLKLTNKYFRRFIKRLAPVTFGVYIIHVHPQIWNIIMANRFYQVANYNTLIMILLVLFISFIIYMLCSYLEMIRLYIFRKLKISNYIDFLYGKFYQIIKKYNSI